MNKETPSLEWRDIKGFEGIYQVSNLGDVKSLPRYVEYGSGKKVWIIGKIKEQTLTTTGYMKVTLSKQGINKDFKVHRLVAIAFIDNPNNKEDVNHLDSCRTNNNVNNLEWATRKENMKHARDNGRMSNYKIDKIDHNEVIDMYHKTKSIYRTALRLNLNHSMVHKIIRKHNVKTYFRNLFYYKGYSDEDVIKMIKSGRKNKDIYEELGVSKSTFARKKQKLKEEGKL